MKVFCIPIGQLSTNCYLVYDSKTYDCIIIDPGDSADHIAGQISKLNLKPKYIIATHAHFDHILAINELKLAFNIPFLLHSKDKKMLSWMRKSSLYFTKVDPGPPPKANEGLIILILWPVSGSLYMLRR